jgi:hypothetical protein
MTRRRSLLCFPHPHHLWCHCSAPLSLHRRRAPMSHHIEQALEKCLRESTSPSGYSHSWAKPSTVRNPQTEPSAIRNATSALAGRLRPRAGPPPPSWVGHQGYVPLRATHQTPRWLVQPSIADLLSLMCITMERSRGELPVLPATPNRFPTVPRPSTTRFPTTSPSAVAGFG